MTDEEHEARAMLLGMRYHHGNGDPIYYEVDDEGVALVGTMMDANTMKPFVETPGVYELIDYQAMRFRKEGISHVFRSKDIR